MNTAPATSLSTILPSASDKKTAITAKETSTMSASSFKDDLKQVEAKKDVEDKPATVSEKSNKASADASPHSSPHTKKVASKDVDQNSTTDSDLSTTDAADSEIQALEGDRLLGIHDVSQTIVAGGEINSTVNDITALDPIASLGEQEVSALFVEGEGVTGLSQQAQQLLAEGVSRGADSGNSAGATTTEALSSPLFSPLNPTVAVDVSTANTQSQNTTLLNNLSLSTELPLALSESFIKNHQQRVSLTDNPLSSAQSILSTSIDGVDNAQVVNSLSAQVKLASDAAPTSPLATTPNFYSPKWQESVTDKVMWMSARGLKEATIQLDPPELGHMTIKVAVVQEQAQVSFTVQHASVREALDSHALRLREMFAEEGIQLADVDVSDQSLSQQDGDTNDTDQMANAESNQEGVAQEESELVMVSPVSRSLIDSYV